MNCVKCDQPLPPGALYCCYCGAPQKDATSAPRRHIRSRGTGSVYKRPGGKYQVTVTLGWFMEDGKRKRRTASRTFVKKSDAINAAAGLMGQRPRSTETLRELHDLYLDGKTYKQLSKSQQDKLSYAWKRLQPIELRPIADLTVDDLQRTVDEAASTYYPARDMKVLLSHLYELAMRREIVTINKSMNIDLPDAPRAKRETWTDADVDLMWQDYEAGNLFTGYILIMCYCGLRYGELATILLENVHLEERYMIGGIKTEAGIDREIPISARILPVIKTFYEARRKKLLEMNEDNFYEKYWDMVERLGLRHLPPQTARHYYFSSMTAAGIQAGIITETGGHASYLTTMKNYVRIPMADKLAAVDQINPSDPPED